MSATRGFSLPVLCLAAATVGQFAAAGRAETQEPLTTYVAEYEASYKGRDVGRAEFSLRYDADTDTFSYVSETRAKGFYRLASPKPIVDRSSFRLVGGRIRPVEFTHQDGSRKGEDNHRIRFDWDREVAVVSTEDGTTEIPLQPGVLDRASLQVAFTTDLAQGIAPAAYTVADDESLKTYHLVREGEKKLDTPIGSVDVVSFSQQREGSSRRTIVDVAPALGFVPVRIEQLRDGEPQSTFTLLSIEID